MYKIDKFQSLFLIFPLYKLTYGGICVRTFICTICWRCSSKSFTHSSDSIATLTTYVDSRNINLEIKRIWHLSWSRLEVQSRCYRVERSMRHNRPWINFSCYSIPWSFFTTFVFAVSQGCVRRHSISLLCVSRIGWLRHKCISRIDIAFPEVNLEQFFFFFEMSNENKHAGILYYEQQRYDLKKITGNNVLTMFC